ncbi:DUF6283 family protein [Streptomyces collinus]|uniref:DUF6283 family protein n=1 Tax=Streptomyces collinus TaxID=42684 RepID=UPI00341D3DEE
MALGHTGRVSSSLRPPAPRPCESCPYRRDVPAGIWASEEYAKLRRYDADTPDQPTGLFQCHQADADSAVRRVCAGWAGCHASEELLALRLAVLDGSMDATTYLAVVEYTSPVPLFPSGSDAAAHGEAGIDAPDETARRVINKIIQTRNDLVQCGVCAPPPAAPVVTPGQQRFKHCPLAGREIPLVERDQDNESLIEETPP